MAKEFRREQVAIHRSADDCWTIIHNKVYDITSWIPQHPGGNLIIQSAGNECTAMFESSHPPFVNESFLEKYKIGELIEEDRDTRYDYHTEFWKTLKGRSVLYTILVLHSC